MTDKTPFVTTDYIRWEDIDLAGIARYSAYTRFLDIAETDLYRSLGTPLSKLHAKYKPDENARDRVIALHRQNNPAANHGNVTSFKDGEAMVQQTLDTLGRLDILVNNAGVRLYHTVEEASAESWDEILGVNLKGYAFCAKAAIPLLRQAGGGSIVNVASVRSVTSVGKTTQYDTTKAAVAGLTRGMAADHAADGIRVNAVCPGPIYTPFHEKRNEAIGRTFDQYRDDAAKGTLLRRERRQVPGQAETRRRTLTIALPARAKLNLDLAVLGRRADGFHDIRTTMQAIEMTATG